MKSLNLHILFVFSLLSTIALAGRIEKGHLALRQLDYFKAKNYFQKAMIPTPAPAAHGLAIIYSRNDNPFFNIDSAFRYIQIALDGFDHLKLKKQQKWAPLGFTKDSLLSLRTQISGLHFDRIQNSQSVQAYTDFLLIHPWAAEKDQAVSTRDSLAFFNAVKVNKSEAFEDFLTSYPQSAFSALAQESFYEAQFVESTLDDSVESYETFIAQNPNSPLKKIAERAVYRKMTESGTIDDYYLYIQGHNESSFRDSAWYDLFQKSMEKYDLGSIKTFLNNFPDNTIKDIVEREKLLIDSIFLPVKIKGAYSYMSTDGQLTFKASYAQLDNFHEGLAIVGDGEHFGLISKMERIQVPIAYTSVSEMTNGGAIVEKSGRFGMVDRVGRIILDPIFEDVGMMAEELCFASLDGKYGYYNRSGEQVIPHRFDDAFDFKNGMAKVVFDNKEALIDQQGNFIMTPCFESVRPLTDSVFIYEEAGKFGLATGNCTKITDASYNRIGELFHGKAMASIEDRLVYINSAGHLVIDSDLKNYPNDVINASFEDSIATIYKDGAFGRMLLNGKIINKPRYENIGDGKQFFAAQLDGFWGVFNLLDKPVVSPVYDDLQLINERFLIVNKSDSIGVLNLGGSELTPVIFDDVEHLFDDVFQVKQNDKVGVYTSEGLLIPFVYDAIGPFNKDILFVEEHGKMSYFLISERRFIELK